MFNRVPSGGGGQAFYDVIVATDGSGDYTSVSEALSEQGENKSYLVRAGTYNETEDALVPSGVYIFWEPENGGVVLNFGGVATFKSAYGAATLHSDLTSTISGTTVTLAGSPDISAVVTTPSNYKYWNKGQSYTITAANNASKSLTLSRSVVNPDGAGSNYSNIFYKPVSNVVMAGKLRLENPVNSFFPLFGFENCDWSGLVMSSNKQIGLALCDVDMGIIKVEQFTYTLTLPRAIGIYQSSGFRGKWVVKGCSGSVAGQTASSLIYQSEDFSVMIDNTGNINTDGGNSNYGIQGSSSRGGTVYGVCTNNETATDSVASINTSSLRTTV